MLHLLLTASLLLDAPIVIDGRFDDWEASSANGLGVTADEKYLYLLVEMEGGPVNLQGLDEPGFLMIDLDFDQSTGSRTPQLKGADLELHFSPGEGKRGGGVQVRVPAIGGQLLNPDVVDLLFAPTAASNRFEIRIPRSLETGDGPVRAGLTCRWSTGGALKAGRGEAPIRQAPHLPRRAFDRPPDCPEGGIRVVSWNVEFGGILDHPEPFVRILRALRPHVLLIQELEPDQTVDAVASVLKNAVPGGWTVDLGPVGGRLRSAVASRLPSGDMPAIDTMKRRDSTDRGVRAAGLRIHPARGPSLAAISLHLKCCGAAEGPEDMTRIAEVLAVRRALAEAQRRDDFQGMIVGGDLNLVGSTLPLELLVEDGETIIGRTGDLLVAEAMRPSGGGMQTWEKDGQRYTPGRLDWIAVTGSSLQIANAFVLATDELPPAVLERLGLSARDTADAADHLPVVVDLLTRP